jgi:uncharacterized lipoprotein NlpE involved in copper resistance
MRACVSFGEPTTILAIFIEIKPHKKSLECNPLNDVSYRNPDMVLNGQGSGRHLLGDATYLDLDTGLNELGLGRHILSDALHRRSVVVQNEQESSHLTRWMRMVRKLAEPNRLCVDI